MRKHKKYFYAAPKKATFSEQLDKDRRDPEIRHKILFLEMFNTMVRVAGGLVMGPTRSVDLDTGAVDYRIHYKTPAGDRLDCEVRDHDIALWYRSKAMIPTAFPDTRPLLLLVGDGQGTSIVVPIMAGPDPVIDWLLARVPLNWHAEMPAHTWAP